MSSFSDNLRMADGVNSLRCEFRRTFDCLEHLQLRLESQIEDGDYPSSINPIKLNQRINALQKILMDLQKRADAVAEKKQEVIPRLVNQLTQNAITVHHLRCKAGLKHTGIPENVLSEFHDETRRHDPQFNGDVDSSTIHSNIGHEPQPMTGAVETDLTEERFNKLPASTKQRVTFEQVNEAYSLIQTLYWGQNKKQRKPIAIKVLAKNGVKLSGQTGSAIINCLRSLRLIQSSKQGIICC